MSTDLATLSIAVDSTGVRKGKDDLDGLSGAAAKAEAYVGKMAAAMAALVAAFAGLKALYDTNAEFQKLHAQLVTVQGSADGASRAFETLKGLAQTTPYELSEVTQAFIDLRTRGMDASAKSITAYGDMASSFGRNLTDTIRAISGVAMGETEAIKSFGVQAQAQGDKVALTFRGQTEIIKRNMTAVEDYFQRLATANFGGGMERQMQTLGGLMSNLKDQIAATLYEIGNAGASGAMGGGIKQLTQAISQATPALVQLASTGTSAIAGLLGTLYQLRYVLGAVALAVAAVQFNTWVSAIAALAAPMARAIALTVALDVATLGYTVSLRTATAAAWQFIVTALQALWAAIVPLLPAIAALAAGLSILYTIPLPNWITGSGWQSLREIRKETQELNAQIEAMEARTAKMKPTLDARDRVKDLKEENDRLERALKGDKTVKIRTTEGQALVNQVRKDGGDGVWAQQVADKLDAEVRRNEKLKAAMDAKNQALRDSGKLAKDAAQEAEREAAAIQSIRDEYSRLTATEAELLAGRIRAAELSPANEREARSLAALINLKRSQAEAEKAIADGLKETAQAMEQIASLQPAMAQTFEQFTAQKDWEWTRGLAGRFTDPRKAAAGEMSVLQANREALSPDTYIRAWRSLRAEISSVWGTLEDGAVSASRTAADAIAAWTTGASLNVREMTRSILADLARIAANRTFSQLFDMGLQALGGWMSGGAPTATTNYQSPDLTPLPSVGGTPLPTAYMAAAPGASGPISVTVNVAPSGQTQVTTEGAGRMGQAFGNAIRAAIADECRPGGVVWETARA